jgi:hypothetical protein
VPEGEVFLAIEYQDRRYRSHFVPARDLSTFVTHQVETDNCRCSFEVPFNPIHDGLCRQAGDSRVAKELDDDGITLGK